MFIPGKTSSEFTLYEDNGDDKNYQKEFATTAIHSEKTGSKLTLTYSPRKDSYKKACTTFLSGKGSCFGYT